MALRPKCSTADQDKRWGFIVTTEPIDVNVLRDYRPQPGELEGRIILITGAGDGIGAALARAIGALGATVILTGRKVSKLEKVYDIIVENGGPTPAIAPFDLERAQGPDYDALIDNLEKEYGRLDGLVNNAGILGERSPIEHYDQVLWQRVLHINLTGSFLMTQACMPLIRRSEDASVIFTSSGVGRRGKAYWGAYSVSKFGVEGLAQVLADELGNNENIRVNCLNPGPTRTAMRSQAYPAESAESNPLPETILGPYLYLLGARGRELSGLSLDCQ